MSEEVAAASIPPMEEKGTASPTSNTSDKVKDAAASADNKEDDANGSVAPSIATQTTSATAAVATSTDGTATLRVVINLFVAHMLTNTVLLSPWNELRCAYWSKSSYCSTDEAWICNWFCYAHLHVSVLLGAVAYSASSNPALLEKLGYLICTIVLCYLGAGIGVLDMLDRTMAGLQCMVYGGVVVSILYLTYRDPDDTSRILSNHVASLNLSDSMSMSMSNSSMGRKKYPLSTMAVGMHLISSIIRVLDMTFGNGRHGYKGDMSSPIYQAISSFAVTDMLLTAAILLFSVLFVGAQQHKLILFAQAFMLLLSLYVLLWSGQGDGIQGDMVVAGSVGSFVFLLVALVGAI